VNQIEQSQIEQTQIEHDPNKPPRAPDQASHNAKARREHRLATAQPAAKATSNTGDINLEEYSREDAISELIRVAFDSGNPARDRVTALVYLADNMLDEGVQTPTFIDDFTN
jgi:hypothetical protein